MVRRTEQRAARVCLGSALLPVGRLRFAHELRRQHSEFQYIESWLEDARAFALAPNLRLGQAPFYASMGATGDPRDSLPEVLQDATPDAWLHVRLFGA